MLDFPKM